jgi:hypothetical protein
MSLKSTSADRQVAPRRLSPTGCLSCGTQQRLKGRKYCSIACRQQLRRQLNLRTGLLKAINTRYATFHFTPRLVVLDVWPYNSEQIFSFIYQRSARQKPVDAFRCLSNRLGNDWWQEQRRTHRRYRATQLVLDNAHTNPISSTRALPQEIVRPRLNGKALVMLNLKRTDLQSAGLVDILKKAFRHQAKRMHPDQGGDASTFIQLRRAYQELSAWAENPVYQRRRGFPDKWFYRGDTNRWVQPISRHR